MGSGFRRRSCRGRGKGGGLDGTRRWVAVVSTEAVPPTGKVEGSDMDPHSERRVRVGTAVPQCAGAHAEYTGGTGWLGREDRTVAPLDKRVLESAWCRYPRMELSFVGLLEAPHCGLEMRRLRVVEHRGTEKGQEPVKRRIREGPSYQVLSKFECDRTFVTTVDDTVYI